MVWESIKETIIFPKNIDNKVILISLMTSENLRLKTRAMQWIILFLFCGPQTTLDQKYNQIFNYFDINLKNLCKVFYCIHQGCKKYGPRKLLIWPAQPKYLFFYLVCSIETPSEIFFGPPWHLSCAPLAYIVDPNKGTNGSNLVVLKWETLLI